MANGATDNLAGREFLDWYGASVVADHSRNAQGPWFHRLGAHLVVGLEIPFLPEPASADTSRGPRTGANASHRNNLLHELSRMVHGLYTPDLWRGNAGDERVLSFVTYDLRITNGRFGLEEEARRGTALTPARLRLFLLVKIFAEETDSSRRDAAVQRALARARQTINRLRAQAPRDLPLQPVRWLNPDEKPGTDLAYAYATPADAALGSLPGKAAGELRQRLFFSKTELPDELPAFEQAIEAEALRAIPLPLRSGTHDLLPTCSAMSAAATGVLLSVRIQATTKTPAETRAMRALRGALRPEVANGPNPLRIDSNRATVMSRAVLRLLLQRELFYTRLQVVGEDASVVEDVLTVLAGEHSAGRPRTTGRRPTAAPPPARVLAVLPPDTRSFELETSLYNIANIEFVPWGAASQNVHRRSTLKPPERETQQIFQYVQTNQHRLLPPELFQQRDVEINPHLARLRGLMTVPEVAALWRVPVPGAGGHAGLVSRPPDPFEQIPRETPPTAGAIRVGRVQHRGVETTQDFRVPFYNSDPQVAGIGDRVIVVAGSPGSGKTNFCLNFLGQLWDNRPDSEREPNDDLNRGGGIPRKCPYLIIDPTRGNEFRALQYWAKSDLLVFTVGDTRAVPFCFNPFIVPRRVSVQSHISRLMSCFKAAFHMWDPLPAIFEMAIRRAYEGYRASWWEKKYPGRKWNASEDFAEGLDEPFPALTDVKKAMGKGTDNDIWSVDGKPTVMIDQREMWGKGTENSATIVASTFLRLESLDSNYSHVIGGPAPGRDCVDIGKLLDRPCVLELGMVGEAAALSLIMGFLLTCLAGTIEDPYRKPKVGDPPPTKPDPSVDPNFPRNYPRQMLVIEEAHRLLGVEGGGGGGKESGSSKAQAAEDINNMLAEVRKFGLGVMLLDQRPASLVGGVIDNAYMVAMHRLNEQASFRQFSEMLNLSHDHQRFARTELRPGEMVTLDKRSGVPVLLRAPLLPKPANALGKQGDEKLALSVLPHVPSVYQAVTSGLTIGQQAEATAQGQHWENLVDLVRQAVTYARAELDRLKQQKPGTPPPRRQASNLEQLAPRLLQASRDLGDAIEDRAALSGNKRDRLAESLMRLACAEDPDLNASTGTIEYVIQFVRAAAAKLLAGGVS